MAGSAEFSEKDQEKTLELIGKLESDSFSDREAAMTELESLPASAVPWLDEMLGETGPSDIELRSRLKSVIRTLKKREAEVALNEGTQVKIKLEAARPGDVLAALSEAAGSALNMPNQHRCWADGSKKKFVFEGSYWDAVDELLKTFPMKSGDRELLSNSGCRMGRWRGRGL